MKQLSFENAKILVVGDVMLDIYKHGTVSRISPEAPIPVVLISREENRAGGAANVAVNLGSLGCQSVELVGYIGDDYTGDQLKVELTKGRVSCNYSTISYSRTISKTRVLADQQHMIRYDNDGTISTSIHREDHEEEFIRRLQLLQQRQSFDVVVVSDYAKGTITKNVMDVIKASFSCPIICDIKPSNASIFWGITCITPNLTEALQLVKMPENYTLIDLACSIKGKLNVEVIVITLSKNGIFLLDQNNESHLFPAYSPISDSFNRVVDVTGAGDTVLSTLSACIAARYNWFDATKLSSLAAGVVVNKSGTTTCSVEELQYENLRV